MQLLVCVLLFVAAISATDPSVGNCDNAKFRTGTEGQWGDPCDSVANDFYGCIRDDYWDICIPGGLLSLGCHNTSRDDEGFDMNFDGPGAVHTYCPQLGPNSVLPLKHNWLDPPQFVNPNDPIVADRIGCAGNFGSQLTALAMNIYYDECMSDTTNGIPANVRSAYSDHCAPLEDIYICDNKFGDNAKKNGLNCVDGVDSGSYANGQAKCWNCEPYYGYQVKDIFYLANKVLGGCCNVIPPPPLICDATWATNSLEIGVNYIVGDHPDGTARPPLYCFRIDDMEKMTSPLFSNNWIWTFSCDKGNMRFMIKPPVNPGNTCGDLVWTGTFDGGRDAGTVYDTWSVSTWSMTYTIQEDDVSVCQLGNGGNIQVNSKGSDDPSHPDTAGAGLSTLRIGTITLQTPASGIFFSQAKHFNGFGPNFSFNVRPKAKDQFVGDNCLWIHQNHRGVSGMSIEGWHQFRGGVTTDWNVFGGAKDWLSVICDPADNGVPTGNSGSKRDTTKLKPSDCNIEYLNSCMTVINQAFSSGNPIQGFEGRDGVFQLATCTAADP